MFARQFLHEESPSDLEEGDQTTGQSQQTQLKTRRHTWRENDLLSNSRSCLHDKQDALLSGVPILLEVVEATCQECCGDLRTEWKTGPGNLEGPSGSKSR